MDPITATAPWWGPPAVAAAGAIGQGFISSAFNMFQADKNRDWQERMSNTAHQREVRDLTAAGLNPILSSSHGGASSPSGSTAQASSPDVVSSALQAATLRGQLELQKAQVRDINSAANLKDIQAADISATQPNRLSQSLAQAYQALQSGNLSGEQRAEVIHRIRQLEAQVKLTNLQSSHSAATLKRADVISKPFEYGAKAIEGAESGFKANFEAFKRLRHLRRNRQPVKPEGRW